MRAKTLTLAALVIALAAPRAAAFGKGDKGTSGAQFLKVAPGARPASMGEAFGAVSGDVHSVYYNPAGLGSVSRVQVTGSHAALFQGVNYEFAAVAVPMLAWVNTEKPKNQYGTLAVSLYNLSVSGIERRSLIETDSAIDTFGAGDFGYALSYGYELPETGLSLGATAKFIDSKIDSYKGSAMAADFGAQYKAGKATLGAGARNAGSRHSLGSGDPLPLTLFGAASYKVSDGLLAAFELRQPRDNSLSAAFGGEYRHEFGEKLSGALRAGYNSANKDADGFNGVSFGVGLGVSNFDFDFALVPFGDLGNAYRYSLVVKF